MPVSQPGRAHPPGEALVMLRNFIFWTLASLVVSGNFRHRSSSGGILGMRRRRRRRAGKRDEQHRKNAAIHLYVSSPRLGRHLKQGHDHSDGYIPEPMPMSLQRTYMAYNVRLTPVEQPMPPAH